MLATQLGTVFHCPCTWNYWTSHLPGFGNAVVGFNPVESAADLSVPIQIFDYIAYIQWEVFSPLELGGEVIQDFTLHSPNWF